MVQWAPELIVVATKKTSNKQALKNTVAKKQVDLFNHVVHQVVNELDENKNNTQKLTQTKNKKSVPDESFLEDPDQNGVVWFFNRSEKCEQIL